MCENLRLGCISGTLLSRVFLFGHISIILRVALSGQLNDIISSICRVPPLNTTCNVDCSFLRMCNKHMTMM